MKTIYVGKDQDIELVIDGESYVLIGKDPHQYNDHLMFHNKMIAFPELFDENESYHFPTEILETIKKGGGEVNNLKITKKEVYVIDYINKEV